MKLAIASGKGGTGKTTVALGLALAAGEPVRLLDCDVEEPNCHLFLQPVISQQDAVTVRVPVVDAAKCNGCGECRRICRFNAIVLLKGRAVVFPELCHSCGGCGKICPVQAIHGVERAIGVVEQGVGQGIALISGRLHVGEALVPTMIRAVKRHAAPTGLTILDCPPGTSCSMVAAVRDADHVLLVTEPTPFGLHDLELAVATVRELDRRFSVIINRADAGDDRVLDFCRAENIPVCLLIPEDRRLAEAYSRGEAVLAAGPGWRDRLRQVLAEVSAITSTTI